MTALCLLILVPVSHRCIVKWQHDEQWGSMLAGQPEGRMHVYAGGGTGGPAMQPEIQELLRLPQQPPIERQIVAAIIALHERYIHTCEQP